MKQENINYNFRTVDKERIEEYFNTGRVSVNDLNKDGQSPLFYAVQRPHDGEDIVKLLLDKGADIYLKDKKGRNVLFYCGHKLVDLLVSLGVDINNIDNYGENALFHCPSTKKAQKLIHHGINLNIYNSEGQHVIHYQKSNNILQYIMSRLDSLDIRDKNNKSILFHFRNIKKLQNLPVNFHEIDENGNTALFKANASKVKILLNKGLDINHINNKGENALFYVKGQKNFNVLIENGININQQDINGNTCIYEHSGLLPSKVFVQNGLDLSLKNKKGLTYFDQLLIELGVFLINYFTVSATPVQQNALLCLHLHKIQQMFDFINTKNADLSLIKNTYSILDTYKTDVSLFIEFKDILKIIIEQHELDNILCNNNTLKNKRL